MRLGHDAMYRQQDMALDDALEFLRSQLSLDLLDRGHRSRASRLLREARSGVEGPMSRSAAGAMGRDDRVELRQDRPQRPRDRRLVEAQRVGGRRQLVDEAVGAAAVGRGRLEPLEAGALQGAAQPLAPARAELGSCAAQLFLPSPMRRQAARRALADPERWIRKRLVDPGRVRRFGGRSARPPARRRSRCSTPLPPQPQSSAAPAPGSRSDVSHLVQSTQRATDRSQRGEKAWPAEDQTDAKAARAATAPRRSCPGRRRWAS